MSSKWLPTAFVLLLAGCAGPRVVTGPTPETMVESVDGFLAACLDGACGFPLDPGSAVDTLLIRDDGTLDIRLNDAFAQTPTREADVDALYQGIRRVIPERPIALSALGISVEDLVPNYLRNRLPDDPARRPAPGPEPRPLTVFPDGPPAPIRGLGGRHIALWASHGWYYEPSLNRWEWQRARLFTTVEDLLPTSFVLPYLAPMLERAGAYVWMPRERDVQSNMVVVDEDHGPGATAECEWNQGRPGFALGVLPYGAKDAPWLDGTHRWIKADPDGGCSLRWTAQMPSPGHYAVYVSHAKRGDATTSARFEIEHAGGTTRVNVDQTMAYSTWVYVGTYLFQESGAVTLSNVGEAGTVVSGDAVRFGGGMGLVERGGEASGRPRWQEGARYTLQFDGMPASLVYNVTDDPANDYVDDYRNRGEWVNYLRGAPLGPNKRQSEPGLGVPIDLSLAFHTDAGIAGGDSTIGTLAIYSSRGFGSDGEEARSFANGRSRFANRDLADRLQSQIVDDIRARYDSLWTRRSIWDRDYSEAYRPNVPSMLLELLSHQNFADMRLALDPAFRFDVSRAIYKGIARYIAFQDQAPEPVIAPLAPNMLRTQGREDGSIQLTWAPVSDPLEPSAEAESYRVYVRRGNGGFDNGTVVKEAAFTTAANSAIVSFKVAALNQGGESATSEVVASMAAAGPRALVINAFDRVGPPAAIDWGRWRGFPEFLDQGVPHGVDLSFVGAQHGFDSGDAWRDDDQPGHGASHADFETQIDPGNTFDFAAGVGAGLVSAGAGAFDTASDEAVAAGQVDMGAYALIYLMLGEERSQVAGHPDRPQFKPFPEGLRRALSQAVDRGVGLLVSGSYPTEELTLGTEEEQAFAERVLGARHRSERASRGGRVAGVVGPFENLEASFNQQRGGTVYAAESPEALNPANDQARTILRYADSNMSAAVQHGRVITIGFPLETIQDTRERQALLRVLIQQLTTRE